MTQAALIHSAFTHEAFLNSLGPKVIDFWDELDRLSVEKKLRVICEAIRYKPDRGVRPYQTLKGLFVFRNTLAHGREEVVRFEGKILEVSKNLDYFDALGPEWEQYNTVENAEIAVEDIDQIAKDLCERADIEKFAGYPFGTMGSGSYTMESI